MPIRNWAGGVLFALGAWLIVNAWRRRRRALTVWRAALARGQEVDVRASQKFALTSAIARPIIYLFLLLVAAEVTATYRVAGPAGPFSIVDLGGFLFVLLGYAIWFSISTRYRDLSYLPAAAVDS